MRVVREEPGPRTASVAATAACPSLHTTARTGNTSPTTALAGRPPGMNGAVSSIAMRPVTFPTVPVGGAIDVMSAHAPIRPVYPG